MAIDEGKLSAWERWELASFEEGGEGGRLTPKPVEPAAPPPPAPPSAEEIETIKRLAREEAFAAGREEGLKRGYDEGYQQGQAEAQEEARRLATVTQALETALTEMEQEVAEEILGLSVELARQVLRHELTAQPDALLDVVRQALAQMPHQHAAIYLHPDDASLARSYLGDQLAHAGHRIHEDARLSRGDCLIESGGSQVDATVATRWQRVIESLGLQAAWKSGDHE
ncbi:MAG: flagellar assembly protein FliH [Rhodocyclaceae bacterium]|nr:flagellar assembly protein FliH [Rhodocyclaceae bacterium]